MKRVMRVLTSAAVAMAVLPTKGLTLPFVSYGGSSLLVNAAAMGILLNISRPRLASGNSPSAACAGMRPEASAVIASEAGFGASSAAHSPMGFGASRLRDQGRTEVHR